eukprot:Phypoly_transcript_15055.p1 GENE.Phypoly_transcript_15055~~Phypoly_transcript_15055.p1  ORF type:complete len:218 (+),score=48.44 Phypoly_transcript_15055:141-794(+)
MVKTTADHTPWVLDDSAFPDFDFNEFRTVATKSSKGWENATVCGTSSAHFWEIDFKSASRNIILGVYEKTKKEPEKGDAERRKIGDDTKSWGWHVETNTRVHKGLAKPLNASGEVSGESFAMYLDASNNGTLFLFQRGEKTTEKGAVEPVYNYVSLLFTGLNKFSLTAAASVHDEGDEVKIVSKATPPKIKEMVLKWYAQASGTETLSSPSSSKSRK